MLPELPYPIPGAGADLLLLLSSKPPVDLGMSLNYLFFSLGM